MSVILTKIKATANDNRSFENVLKDLCRKTCTKQEYIFSKLV